MKQLNHRTRWQLFLLSASVLAGTIKALSVTKGFGDNDFFWQSVLGQYILQNRMIPTQDIFSWISIEKGYAETAHSWLGSLIIYFFSKIFNNGIYGGLLYTGITVSILSYLLMRWYGLPFDKENPVCDFLNGFYTLAVGLFACLTHMTARPLNIGLILFLISVFLEIDAYENQDNKKWLLLPIISLCWANMHGGSVPILFAFNAAYIVISLLPSFNFLGISQEKSYTKSRTVRMIAILFADMAAGIINPYGLKLYTYFFITNSSLTKKYINEWQQSTLDVQILVSVAVLVITIALANRSEKKLKLSYMLPFAATFAMSVLYARIQSYLIISSVVMAYPVIHNAVCDYEPKLLNSLRAKQLTVLLSILSILLLCVTVVSGMVNVEKLDTLSPELLKAIDEVQPQRIYNDYNTGGLLIYHGFKSFIDSRADPFDDEVLESAIKFCNLNDFSCQEAENYLNSYQFDAILIPANAQLQIYLELSNDWILRYGDELYTFWVPA